MELELELVPEEEPRVIRVLGSGNDDAVAPGHDALQPQPALTGLDSPRLRDVGLAGALQEDRERLGELLLPILQLDHQGRRVLGAYELDGDHDLSAGLRRPEVERHPTPTGEQDLAQDPHAGGGLEDEVRLVPAEGGAASTSTRG